MGIRIGKNNFLIIIILLLIGTSCNPTISDMENIVGMKLKDKISFQKKEEQWIPFNGDGYKIMIYKIKENELKTIIEKSKENGFDCYEADSLDNFSNSYIYPFIEHSKGYYKIICIEDEIKTVFIDSTHSRLIYYLVIW